MNSRIPLTRAARRFAVPAIGLAVLICACPAQAFTPAVKGGSENTRLDLSSGASTAHTSSGGGPSLTRTIVGLLIVIAVIWGLTWILRQVKSGRETRSAGSGLSSVATLPLGSGRTLHLVRAGREYLLVGSAEHGVVPIHRYTEQQARELGLLDPAAESGDEDDNAGSGWTDERADRRPRTGGTAGGSWAGKRIGRQANGQPMQIPGQRRAGGSPATNLVDRLREWTVRR
jgi:flagellar protein FliO/FliZ